MSDLTKRPDWAPPPAPRMSNWLQQAVHDAANPHPDAGAPSLPAAVRDEAARAYDQLRAHLRPADAEDWHRFLLPIVTMVANAPERDAFARDCRAIAFAMPDMPAALLTTDRQREALRRFKFWPKPAELNEWLEPAATSARAPLHSLRRIMETQPARHSPADPAERERISAGFKALAAELRNGSAEESRPAPKARYLTGATLNAMRQAAGIRIPEQPR